MGNCVCDHCDCEKDDAKSPEDKVGALKEAIKELGFKVEEDENGEIKISE